MHTCIMKLLGEGEKTPNEEDVEALCKLMTTVGGQLDHQKAKAYMDAYFRRMEVLSKSEEMSSRHRFMLQDVIDTRAKGWRERRKEFYVFAARRCCYHRNTTWSGNGNEAASFSQKRR